ncbi:conserved hypothetical protein [Ricinus communis]|uniref:Uncharacterized protein n=1 Tax=Ricinus communis TaxID=3988 RepID=B9RF12_RICCO|nr:conserved hypothetical protein [Ricinus communis]|eukprot:XP_002512331.1 uncharacterized protein LOC8285515 [Ricinus communis]
MVDQRKDHLQTLGICNRLYNFIKKLLLMHAYKSVILGDPLYRDSAETETKAANENDHMAHSKPQEEKLSEVAEDQAHNMNNSDPSVQLSDELTAFQDNNDNVIEPGKEPEAVEAKPPKKSVSISDRVEEIDTRKKIRRKKSKENLILVEEEEEEPKPLRSILKVGSYSGENKSNSFVNPTIDG